MLSIPKIKILHSISYFAELVPINELAVTVMKDTLLDTRTSFLMGS